MTKTIRKTIYTRQKPNSSPTLMPDIERRARNNEKKSPCDTEPTKTRENAREKKNNYKNCINQFFWRCWKQHQFRFFVFCSTHITQTLCGAWCGSTYIHVASPTTLVWSMNVNTEKDRTKTTSTQCHCCSTGGVCVCVMCRCWLS